MLSKDTKVNHYSIVDKIGQGGMGEVFLAHDSKLDRKVALKFLSEELGRDDHFRKRFTREAQAVARLNHPNIVTVHEVGEYENRPFIAMTFVKGEALDKIIARGKLSIREVVDIGIQISDGLAAAHSQGITHRDLKPGNIIIDENEKIQILDFGLAALNQHAAAEESDKTRTKLTDIGAVMGTVEYMAPEQLRGQAVDHLADIFALGVILHELTCGTRPFVGTTPAEISSSILRDTPRLISEMCPDVPYDLQRVIGRCLQKDPGRRFQSIKDVKNELEDLRVGDSVKRLAIDLNSPQMLKNEAVSEGVFILTADLVRKLENRSPKMIGGKMSYVVNAVRSETLMIVMHNVAVNQNSYLPVIDKLPCTCVLPTLFGWDWTTKYRPALSVSDHSTILRKFFKFCKTEFSAKRIILTGHASSSSHLLQMLTSPEGFGIKVEGLLQFVCNLELASCFITKNLAEMDCKSDSSILSKLLKISAETNSLDDWVRFQTYLVALIQRFGGELEPLQRYSAGIVKPFQDDDLNVFPQRYKAAVLAIPLLRFVFSKDEYPLLDRLLQRHLEENVLGDDYAEETIVRLDLPHFQVGRPEVFLEQALTFLKEFEKLPK